VIRGIAPPRGDCDCHPNPGSNEFVTARSSRPGREGWKSHRVPGTYVGVELPDERAEVAVLEVLREELAGELVGLVNRELRAFFAPRHDVFTRSVVHHVVPTSNEKGGSGSEDDGTRKSESRARFRGCAPRGKRRTLYAETAASPRQIASPLLKWEPVSVALPRGSVPCLPARRARRSARRPARVIRQTPKPE
jgi:hypothetical protein